MSKLAHSFMLIINQHFNFCRCTALAYTTLDRRRRHAAIFDEIFVVLIKFVGKRGMRKYKYKY